MGKQETPRQVDFGIYCYKNVNFVGFGEKCGYFVLSRMCKRKKSGMGIYNFLLKPRGVVLKKQRWAYLRFFNFFILFSLRVLNRKRTSPLMGERVVITRSFIEKRYNFLRFLKNQLMFFNNRETCEVLGLKKYFFCTVYSQGYSWSLFFSDFLLSKKQVFIQSLFKKEEECSLVSELAWFKKGTLFNFDIKNLFFSALNVDFAGLVRPITVKGETVSLIKVKKEAVAYHYMQVLSNFFAEKRPTPRQMRKEFLSYKQKAIERIRKLNKNKPYSKRKRLVLRRPKPPRTEPTHHIMWDLVDSNCFVKTRIILKQNNSTVKEETKKLELNIFDQNKNLLYFARSFDKNMLTKLVSESCVKLQKKFEVFEIFMKSQKLTTQTNKSNRLSEKLQKLIEHDLTFLFGTPALLSFSKKLNVTRFRIKKFFHFYFKYCVEQDAFIFDFFLQSKYVPIKYLPNSVRTFEIKIFQKYAQVTKMLGENVDSETIKLSCKEAFFEQFYRTFLKKKFLIEKKKIRRTLFKPYKKLRLKKRVKFYTRSQRRRWFKKVQKPRRLKKKSFIKARSASNFANFVRTKTKFFLQKAFDKLALDVTKKTHSKILRKKKKYQLRKTRNFRFGKNRKYHFSKKLCFFFLPSAVRNQYQFKANTINWFYTNFSRKLNKYQLKATRRSGATKFFLRQKTKIGFFVSKFNRTIKPNRKIERKYNKYTQKRFQLKKKRIKKRRLGKKRINFFFRRRRAHKIFKTKIKPIPPRPGLVIKNKKTQRMYGRCYSSSWQTTADHLLLYKTNLPLTRKKGKLNRKFQQKKRWVGYSQARQFVFNSITRGNQNNKFWCSGYTKYKRNLLTKKIYFRTTVDNKNIYILLLKRNSKLKKTILIKNLAKFYTKKKNDEYFVENHFSLNKPKWKKIGLFTNFKKFSKPKINQKKAIFFNSCFIRKIKEKLLLQTSCVFTKTPFVKVHFFNKIQLNQKLLRLKILNQNYFTNLTQIGKFQTSVKKLYKQERLYNFLNKIYHTMLIRRWSTRTFKQFQYLCHYYFKSSRQVFNILKTFIQLHHERDNVKLFYYIYNTMLSGTKKFYGLKKTVIQQGFLKKKLMIVNSWTPTSLRYFLFKKRLFLKNYNNRYSIVGRKVQLIVVPEITNNFALLCKIIANQSVYVITWQTYINNLFNCISTRYGSLINHKNKQQLILKTCLSRFFFQKKRGLKYLQADNFAVSRSCYNDALNNAAKLNISLFLHRMFLVDKSNYNRKLRMFRGVYNLIQRGFFNNTEFLIELYQNLTKMEIPKRFFFKYIEEPIRPNKNKGRMKQKLQAKRQKQNKTKKEVKKKKTEEIQKFYYDGLFDNYKLQTKFIYLFNSYSRFNFIRRQFYKQMFKPQQSRNSKKKILDDNGQVINDDEITFFIDKKIVLPLKYYNAHYFIHNGILKKCLNLFFHQKSTTTIAFSNVAVDFFPQRSYFLKNLIKIFNTNSFKFSNNPHTLFNTTSLNTILIHLLKLKKLKDITNSFFFKLEIIFFNDNTKHRKTFFNKVICLSKTEIKSISGLIRNIRRHRYLQKFAGIDKNLYDTMSYFIYNPLLSFQKLISLQHYYLEQRLIFIKRTIFKQDFLKYFHGLQHVLKNIDLGAVFDLLKYTMQPVKETYEDMDKYVFFKIKILPFKKKKSNLKFYRTLRYQQLRNLYKAYNLNQLCYEFFQLHKARKNRQLFLHQLKTKTKSMRLLRQRFFGYVFQKYKITNHKPRLLTFFYDTLFNHKQKNSRIKRKRPRYKMKLIRFFNKLLKPRNAKHKFILQNYQKIKKLVNPVQNFKPLDYRLPYHLRFDAMKQQIKNNQSNKSLFFFEKKVIQSAQLSNWLIFTRSAGYHLSRALKLKNRFFSKKLQDLAVDFFGQMTLKDTFLRLIYKKIQVQGIESYIVGVNQLLIKVKKCFQQITKKRARTVVRLLAFFEKKNKELKAKRRRLAKLKKNSHLKPIKNQTPLYGLAALRALNYNDVNVTTTERISYVKFFYFQRIYDESNCHYFDSLSRKKEIKPSFVKKRNYIYFWERRLSVKKLVVFNRFIDKRFHRSVFLSDGLKKIYDFVKIFVRRGLLHLSLQNLLNVLLKLRLKKKKIKKKDFVTRKFEFRYTSRTLLERVIERYKTYLKFRNFKRRRNSPVQKLHAPLEPNRIYRNFIRMLIFFAKKRKNGFCISDRISFELIDFLRKRGKLWKFYREQKRLHIDAKKKEFMSYKFSTKYTG